MLMKIVTTIHLKITLLKSYTSLGDNAITNVYWYNIILETTYFETIPQKLQFVSSIVWTRCLFLPPAIPCKYDEQIYFNDLL